MTERLTRYSPADLELRGGDGRTITGIAMPWDEPAEVRDGGGLPYTEVFRRGAFAKTIRERGPRAVKSFAKHQRSSLPIGRASVLREDPVGLYTELRVSKTVTGDEVLELVRDGALDGLSVGFVGIKERQTRDGVERLEVALHEISIVDAAAYASAMISGVRSDEHRISPEVAARRLDLLDRTWRT